jgi:integrase/recombinase XerD
MKIKSNRKTKRYNKKETTKVEIVEILTTEQTQAIDTISNDRDKAICQFLLNTGLRVDEMVNLNYRDCFEDIRSKTIRDSITVIGKGNKERMIPLNQTAKNTILAIDKYNRQQLQVKGINLNHALLVSQKKSRLSKRQIERMVNSNLDTHPHVFRHTCFTNLRKRNTPLEVIQKVAGHSDITTTARYYLNVNNEDLTNAMNAIDQQGMRLVAASA